VTTYTYAQLEQLWINNGGARSLAPVAAAIAEAESGGNPAANNYTDNNGTQTSWGLWQISDGTHNMPVANINDPNVNAREAVAKYEAAGGWSPWGTYDSGAYKAFLSGSTTPDPNVPAGGSGPSGASGDTQQPPGDGKPCLIGPFPHTSFCVLQKSQARALIGGSLVAAGSGVMVVGVILLMAIAIGRGAGRAANVVALVPTPQAQAAAGAMRSPRAAAGQQARATAAAQRKQATAAKAAQRKQAKQAQAQTP